jgi:hypothetical protein
MLQACRQPATGKIGSITIDPTLESLVPPDTVFIMGADVDAIRNTAVYQKHIGIIELPRLNEFTRRTGIDPRKDISQVLSVADGKSGVLLVRGRFNIQDVESRLEHEGAHRTPYKNVALFGDERTAVLFLDPNTAAAGPTPALKAIVDDREKPRHGLPEALAARVRTVPAGSQIWAAFIGGVQGLNVAVPPNSNLAAAVQVLRGLDNAMLAIDLRNGFDLHGDAQCKTDADAKRLHDALKGIIGFGRLSTPDSKPELLKLYDAIQVEQAGDKVTIAAHLPPDMVDNFLDLWLKRR